MSGFLSLEAIAAQLERQASNAGLGEDCHVRVSDPAFLIASLRHADREAKRAIMGVCDGCGTSWLPEEIKVGKHLSCCPERKMLTASEWRERAMKAEQENTRLLQQRADATMAAYNVGNENEQLRDRAVSAETSERHWKQRAEQWEADNAKLQQQLRIVSDLHNLELERSNAAFDKRK